jgi:hypothetical protein
MEAAGKVNYRVRSGDTVQGFYTMAADGTAFGFENVRDPKVVDRMLTEAEDAFHKTPPAKVEISTENIPSVFALAPEKTVSVARVFTRVRPIPLGANALNKTVGRDHLWILGSDVRAIFDAGAREGTFKMPDPLAGRIVRFNLIDNVRGEPDLWLPDQVKKADFSMKLISHMGTQSIFSFNGLYAQKTSDGKRGLDGTIRGEMTLDSATNRVVRFRAYAEAQAWGDSKFTKYAPDGKFGLVVAMIDVDDKISANVPPEGIRLASEYFDPTVPVLAGRR